MYNFGSKNSLRNSQFEEQGICKDRMYEWEVDLNGLRPCSLVGFIVIETLSSIANVVVEYKYKFCYFLCLKCIS
jgi:hypothetical protein